MFNIIGAAISGLVVGVLARWFYPGAVEMGWIATILLGLGGSLVAGLVAAVASPQSTTVSMVRRGLIRALAQAH